ncbi:MAG: AtpZ/AtpI family protein [Acidimicrobiales bacterium]
MEVRDRRDLYNGFGDTLARAFEMVVTPMLFGLGGWFLDRRLGTIPLFSLVLGLVALVGIMVRMYYAYQADMERHQREAPWARRPLSGHR